MKRWGTAGSIVAICALFLILNRGAYQGFFQDDELDNIVLTRALSPKIWVSTFLTPELASDNFRPVGHIYFAIVNRLAGLNFPRYVLPVHMLHAVNGVLLWLFLRSIGLGWVGCASGFAFFMLNVAAFDAYWKPMYIFDVLCTTFCLAALLLYARGKWLLALPCFWLAYKSKELAVMLPLVLAVFEFYFGGRKWKRLIPFFLISLSFGLQALVKNHGRHDDYSLVFSWNALWTTFTFYSSRLFFAPFAGLALVILPIFIRDRRMRMGFAILAVFFFPLLFLPGRLYAAYCYLPLTGAAIEIATLASLVPPVWVGAFFAVWLPWNIFQLRIDRRTTLAADNDARIYVGSLLEYMSSHPKLPTLAFSQLPTNFQLWGVQAAVNYSRPNQTVPIRYMSEAEIRALPMSAVVTIFNWDKQKRKLVIVARNPAAKALAYLKMDAETPLWQLEKGWYDLNDYFRWTEPRATARLSRPAGATAFEVVANVSPVLLQRYGHTTLQLSVDGKIIGARRFEQPGIQTVRWDLPTEVNATAEIVFDIEPAAQYPPDTRLLGLAIVSFGMITPNLGH